MHHAGTVAPRPRWGPCASSCRPRHCRALPAASGPPLPAQACTVVAPPPSFFALLRSSRSLAGVLRLWWWWWWSAHALAICPRIATFPRLPGQRHGRAWPGCSRTACRSCHGLCGFLSCVLQRITRCTAKKIRKRPRSAPVRCPSCHPSAARIMVRPRRRRKPHRFASRASAVASYS